MNLEVNNKNDPKIKTNLNIAKDDESELCPKKQTLFSELIKILTTLFKKFSLFYTLRAALSLIQLFLKIKFKFTKISLEDILKIIFNTNNLRTGLFLSLMPALYKILELFYNFGFFSKFITEPKLFTFIAGFLSSLLGIVIGEKGDIMVYIILSIMVRTIHSLIVVKLKKHGYPAHNKLVAWLALTAACSGVLFIYFYHEGFLPILKLVNGYALFEGNESEELQKFRSITGIFKQN